MDEYRIRRYEDCDYVKVRAIFSQGINEHVPAATFHCLRCPQTYLLLLGLFLVTYVISASFVFSLAVVFTLLGMGWFHMKHMWAQYVRDALATDLLDIRKAYLEPKDCCFWVVESSETVVGMVAAIEPENPSQRGHALELKRMSVEARHRGRGLSKALTRTVIRFAQERGYRAVVLSTSMVQYTAQRVYEAVGFRKVKTFYPSFLAKLIQFYIICYHYEIPRGH